MASPDNSAARNREFIKILLEQSATLKADDIAQLAQGMEALTDTVRQVAGSPNLPETEVGALPRSWASREEQGRTSAGLNC